MYKITEIINDTISNYHLGNLPERYNGALLKRTELTMKEKDNVMEKLKIVKLHLFKYEYSYNYYYTYMNNLI